MTSAESRDRYQPDTRLEAGLGGERWLATDRKTGRVVWMGVLDARAATEAHRRAFDAWIRVAPSLSHPSLEKFLDAGETALGNPFFAVESIDAETLAARLDREPAMSIHELVRVVTAVVDGLLVAHRVGLVHGDLAPDRVYLLTGGRARVAGFGMNRAVARSQDASREASTLPYGDAFMSPEQAQGGEATTASDVWSIAAILYRGITGIPPRAGMDGRSTCAGIVEGPTLPVLQLRPDLPASFVQLLDRALGPDPSKRFKDVAELRKALTSALILAPAVARLPVMASPLPDEGGGGLETSAPAPALPPPPKRTQIGIGPLSRVAGADSASNLAALAPVEVPSKKAPPEEERLSAAPALLPVRESDPVLEEADLLEDDDDDAVMTSAAPRSVHPPKPLAERGVPPKTAPPPVAPRAKPPSDPPPPLPGAPAPHAPLAAPVPSAPIELPIGSPSDAAGMLAAPSPAASTELDYGAPAEPARIPGTKSALPPKAWAAIFILGIGVAVAASGLAKLARRGTTEDGATGALAGTTGTARPSVDSNPNTNVTTGSTTPEVLAPVDAGLTAPAAIDAGAPAVVVAIDAGQPLPPPPPVVVPIATGTTSTRPTGTTGRTHSTGTTTTNVAPMTTTTPMVEAPMVETPMTTPMTDTAMHSLVQDPGF